MSINLSFRPPIPKGMRIFTSTEIVGIAHYRGDAIKFVNEKGQRLRLAPEPTNQNDPNAIRVTGLSIAAGRENTRVLGYLNRILARTIISGGFVNEVLPRLWSAWVSSQDFVNVELDLVGPKPRFEEFCLCEQEAEIRDVGLFEKVAFEPYWRMRLKSGRLVHAVICSTDWRVHDSQYLTFSPCSRNSHQGSEATFVENDVTCEKCLEKLPRFLEKRVPVICGICEVVHSVQRRYLGRHAECKSCGKRFRIGAMKSRLE